MAIKQKAVILALTAFLLFSTFFVGYFFVLNQRKMLPPLTPGHDYLVYQKSEPSQEIKVFRSGKVLGLGKTMFVDYYNESKLQKLASAILATGILNKDCKAEQPNSADYTIQLGSQTKRIIGNGCQVEIAKIESQIVLK